MGNDQNKQDAKVDQQDGGPGSHTEDDTGGTANDVASGGQSEFADEDDDTDDQGS